MSKTHTHDGSEQIETRDPDDLTPHPKNDEIYGDTAPPWFIESIEQKGVREPIVVTEESHFESGQVVISGHRRTGAAIQAEGIDEVPVRFEEYDTAAEELEALVDYNQQREKNFSQKMREALELEAVERSRAKGRQGSRTDLDQNFGGGQFGTASEKVAEMVGFGNPETYRQARKVWMKKEEGYDWAEGLVESLDGGEESIYGAYTEVKKIEERLQNQERIQWEELEQINSFYLGSDVVQVFDENRGELGDKNHWRSAVTSLYEKWGEHWSGHVRGPDPWYVFEAFLYLLEKHGYADFDGDLTKPETYDPPSLVDRKPSSDTLNELYWDEGRSRGEIGFRYSIHPLLVSLWMFEEDIPLQRSNLRDRVVRMIEERRDDLRKEDEEAEDDDKGRESTEEAQVDDENQEDQGDWSSGVATDSS